MACRRWLLISALFVLLAGPVVRGRAEEDAAGGVVELRDLRFTIEPGGAGEQRGVVLRVAQPGPLYLGVALQEHVGPVTIQEVLPDSPAAKAGLKVGDVVLACGDTRLKSAVELRDLVQASEGKPLKLKVRRDGQELELPALPVRRPTDGAIVTGEADKLDGDVKQELQKRLRALHEAMRQPAEAATPSAPHSVPAPAAGAGGLSWHMTPAILPAAPAPENLEVTIKKKGNQPARVRVRLGDQTWNIKDGQFDKLPPTIRGHVARMLPGHGATVHVVPGMGMMPGMAPPGAHVPQPGVAPYTLPRTSSPWSLPSPPMPVPLPASPVPPPTAVPYNAAPPAAAPATPAPAAVFVPAPVPALPSLPAGESSSELQQLKKQVQELREQVEKLLRK